MILLLGATSYVGQAFAEELRRRATGFIPLSRSALDYTRFEVLFDYIRKMRPSLVINAAGYAGVPNVDACEVHRMETFQDNTILPQTISRACLMTQTPLGHVSSGSIFTGAKVFENGHMRVERDLNQHGLRELFEADPERFFGFTELDEPNATFRNPPCSFHSGTKALAEEALRGAAQTYIWRSALPFDHRDHPCNVLTKLQTYARIFDHITSLSHRGDFVRACLDLALREAPFGTYNVSNPGAVSTRQVAALIRQSLAPDKAFAFWESDEHFYREAAKAPRSCAILDVTKLLRTGVKVRPVEHALEDSLQKWQAAVSVAGIQPFDPTPA